MFRHTLLVGLALMATLLPGRPAAQDLPIPTQWRTHFATLLVANPDYAPESEQAERALTAAHIQYQLRLQKEGRAIAAGGLAPMTGDPLIGLTILRAGTRDEAQAIADADPAVRAGRFLARVREWWVPAGQLPEGPSRD
jgi:uncharacterized protein YciI